MYVSQDTFDRTLTALLAWRSSGAAHVLVGQTVFRPPVTVSVVERHPQVLAFLDETSLTLGKLREAITDVVDVLQAAVSATDEEGFAAVRTDKKRFDDGETEEAEQARKKFRAVMSSFDLEDLRRRNWVKTTSKLPFATALEGEVLTKHSDLALEAPDPAGVNYGLIRIKTESPDIVSFFAAPPSELTMVVDDEDLSFLISSLESLRDYLTATNRKQRNG